jgi:ribosome-associated protein
LNDEIESDGNEGPSKTQRKADAHALQTLGAELVALNRAKLDQVDLPESLRDAIIAAQNITKHEARRRQMQFIGKLMRHVDAGPIRVKLDAWKSVSAADVAHAHLLERWRDKLLAEPDAPALLANEYPHANLQQVRTLIRNVQREREQNRPPKNYRALFQVLREIIVQPEPPHVHAEES